MTGWQLIAIVVALVALCYLASRFGWIDLSNKNRTGPTAGSGMGIGDEVFNPTRHEAQIELDRQTILPAPAPTPGDPGVDDTGIYDGQVEIDLDDQRH
ncbi:MAG: hypothetical protein JWQ43_1140 [Glaciihabitans sp.]|nr:hypothetical protein [Glaciihabitans sp.]